MKFFPIFAAIFAVPLFAACSDSPSSGLASVPLAARQAVVTTYAEHVKLNYDEVNRGAAAMKAAVDAFASAPSAETLEAAKAAWKAVRPAYARSEAYRFYGGPIDGDDGPEGRINAWPLDENYIDSVAGNPTTGFVNDTTFQITEESIASLNEIGGEKNIATGWHAIEFMLWGQDFSTTGPGSRPFTDFVDGTEATLPNGARRRAYLLAVTNLLLKDLASLSASWAPSDAANYRGNFVADVPEKSLSKILKGMGALAAVELPNERMNNAYSRREQEEETSCFSDTTSADLVGDAEGIQNVWLGVYGDKAGASFAALAGQVDNALAEKTTADVAALVAATQQIPTPFDNAIFDDAKGRPAIKAAIVASGLVKHDLEDVAAAMSLTINFED